MKNISLLLFIIFSLQVAAQNTYYVTVVVGNIYRNQNKIKIQIGDKIAVNERLLCTSKLDYLIILNSKGRYKISAKNSAKPGELIDFIINDQMHIHAENVRLSSRALGDEIMLSNYFKPTVEKGEEVNKGILITNELKIPVRNMGYVKVDNKEDFFFLQLIDSSKNGINKKLIVKNDSLLLTREDLTFNGRLYSEQDGILNLGFVKGYSKEKNISKIAYLKPVFVSMATIRQIVQAVKLALSNTSKDEVINEIYTQLYYIYGKPDRQLIVNIFDGKM